MFEGLSGRLQDIVKRLKGKGKLSEQDIDEALREVRLALLEADVNFKVVKDFTQRVKERASGRQVMDSLTPGQQVVKVVHDELTELMGQQHQGIRFAADPPTVFILVGLQGSGKTTTAAKLALHVRKEGRQPLLVAADLQRPAAVEQLQSLGRDLDIPVFARGVEPDPMAVASESLREARRRGRDVVIVDTAGRLHVDHNLMDELNGIISGVDPDEVLLVVDAMTGQDAVKVADSFASDVGIDGVILTKLDGDTRAGAALSVRSVTGKPIKFVGTGEKPGDLEAFHPERMASRILGMGDVLTLIEKAEASMDEKKVREMEKRLRDASFSFDDFLEQLNQVRNMGPMSDILGMLPGFSQANQLKNLEFDESQLDRVEAIIHSMTLEERQRPEIIDGSRRRRIARGSGTRIQEVNQLLKQFKQTKKLMKQLNGKKMKNAQIPGMGSFDGF